MENEKGQANEQRKVLAVEVYFSDEGLDAKVLRNDELSPAQALKILKRIIADFEREVRKPDIPQA